MPNMPKLHEREKVTRSAKKLLLEALDGVDKLELTEWEYIQVCQEVLGGVIQNMCRHGIRLERHGDADTPGGFEKEDGG